MECENVMYGQRQPRAPHGLIVSASEILPNFAVVLKLNSVCAVVIVVE